MTSSDTIRAALTIQMKLSLLNTPRPRLASNSTTHHRRGERARRAAQNSAAHLRANSSADGPTSSRVSQNTPLSKQSSATAISATGRLTSSLSAANSSSSPAPTISTTGSRISVAEVPNTANSGS